MLIVSQFILSSLVNSGVPTIEVEEDMREKVVSNFRGAAIMYAVSFVLSLGCIWKAKQGARYELPESDLRERL